MEFPDQAPPKIENGGKNGFPPPEMKACVPHSCTPPNRAMREEGRREEVESRFLKKEGEEEKVGARPKRQLLGEEGGREGGREGPCEGRVRRREGRGEKEGRWEGRRKERSVCQRKTRGGRGRRRKGEGENRVLLFCFLTFFRPLSRRPVFIFGRRRMLGGDKGTLRCRRRKRKMDGREMSFWAVVDVGFVVFFVLFFFSMYSPFFTAESG